MIIRIMRHGDAPTINGERQLSHQGIKEVRLIGQWLSEQPEINMLLISPILRAQQTSQQLEPFLSNHYRRGNEELLRPEANAEIACQYFESLSVKSLLLISHMPLVTNLLDSWLPGQGKYFPTASIAELEIISGKAKLLSFMQPSDLL